MKGGGGGRRRGRGEREKVREKKGEVQRGKRCFGTQSKLFRESGDFSGNRDT